MGDFQNAFVLGRIISDNCLLVHEMMNMVRKRKKGARLDAVFKIDLNKAYDRISWDFLESLLKEMGFPVKWVQWIMQCVSTVSYSVLVNGEPTGKLYKRRDFGKGTPFPRTCLFSVWSYSLDALFGCNGRDSLKA